MAVLPAVPEGDLLEWTAGADVAFVGAPPRTLNQRLTLPNKLFQSLMAGVPIVVGTGTEHCRLTQAEARRALLRRRRSGRDRGRRRRAAVRPGRRSDWPSARTAGRSRWRSTAGRRPGAGSSSSTAGWRPRRRAARPRPSSPARPRRRGDRPTTRTRERSRIAPGRAAAQQPVRDRFAVVEARPEPRRARLVGDGRRPARGRAARSRDARRVQRHPARPAATARLAPDAAPARGGDGRAGSRAGGGLAAAGAARSDGPWSRLVGRGAQASATSARPTRGPVASPTRCPAADIWQAEGLITLPVALALRRRRGGRAVYDARDLRSRAPGSRRLPGPWRRLLARRERAWARSADAIDHRQRAVRRGHRADDRRPADGRVQRAARRARRRRARSRSGSGSGSRPADRIVLDLGNVAPGRGIEALTPGDGRGPGCRAARRRPRRRLPRPPRGRGGGAAPRGADPVPAGRRPDRDPGLDGRRRRRGRSRSSRRRSTTG